MKPLSRIKNRFWIDRSTKRFIAHNKRKWRNDPRIDRDAAVLVDLFNWNPQIYCFSYLANYFAAKSNASIVAFHFSHGLFNRLGLPQRRLERIFESFGAGLGLSFDKGPPFRSEAYALADKAFAGLKTKWDVQAIEFDGVNLGVQLYDTYLRSGRATVDLKDPALRDTIRDAFLIYFILRDFFNRKAVKAIFTVHCVYNSNAIAVKLAMKHGIPVFFIHTDNLLVIEILRGTVYHSDYHHYKEMFAAFPEAEKPKYRAIAADFLAQRLGGKIDPGTSYMKAAGRSGLTGYGDVSSVPLMKNTGRPRVAILLNCFFDAPHGYRYLLYPDHWEWINALLARAEQTPFDWYVKPHPGGLPGNKVIVEQLKKLYPKINFLDVTASNSQLAQEGLAAMFTSYGTAAHEFAYMGIPVVNAGDNPHITFDFNFHPKTIMEYEKYIENAGHLKLDIRKSEVEEFYYMNYIYAERTNEFGIDLIDEASRHGKVGLRVNESSIFNDYIRGETPEKDQKLTKYFDSFFAKYLQPGDKK